MKAIILSHERGGSYVMDHNGCYWFVKGHAARLIGSEIDFKPQPQVSLAQIASMAACIVLIVLIGCVKELMTEIRQAEGKGTPQSDNGNGPKNPNADPGNNNGGNSSGGKKGNP